MSVYIYFPKKEEKTTKNDDINNSGQVKPTQSVEQCASLSSYFKGWEIACALCHV